jgi:hypothetical protein
VSLGHIGHQPTSISKDLQDGINYLKILLTRVYEQRCIVSIKGDPACVTSR